ncbi:putative monocarboxylate transporter mch1 [Fusarium solani]|nr:putative monocarboxylate transporter mch1 [Fusarium solani]
MASIQLLQTVSFTCSILNSLIAGCMSTIPIYGPRLILDIGYTQAQLNAVITVAMLSAYLTSPVGGYLCRQLSPRVLSLICGGLLGGGYLLTASVFFVSHRPNVEAVGSSFWKVLFAHFMIGSGTSSIQLSALDACAKNLLQSRYKGMLMSVPATAVGVGGIALSQMASHLFMTNQDPGSAPYLDAGRFLVLLSSLAMAVGLISAVGLVVVQKEVAMSLVLIIQVEDSDQTDHLIPKHQAAATYGTIDEGDASTSASSDASNSGQQACEEGENPLFRDQALWWFMGGMALLPGTIAVYLNNLGTITAAMSDDSTDQGSKVVQQITILSTVATVARLTLGVISDRVAPAPELPLGQTSVYRTRFIVLVVPAILVSIGYLLLATPLARSQYSNIALHLCSALLGLGYGCNSAAMPVVAQAWGPESFSIICSWISLSPAPAIAVWGWLYSFLYEWALDTTRSSQCHEWSCYGIWALASSATAICAAFTWAMSCAQLRSRGINV